MNTPSKESMDRAQEIISKSTYDNTYSSDLPQVTIEVFRAKLLTYIAEALDFAKVKVKKKK